MFKRFNWKVKSIVLAVLVALVVLPLYPSLGMAQDAASGKDAPKLAAAGDTNPANASLGSGATGAGTGSAGLSNASIYGIVGAVVIGGTILAISLGNDDNGTTSDHP